VGYEIDFLPVGDGSRSGDAIALRYGNLHGPRDEQTVIVIDGGFSDDGKALVDHITTYYDTDQVDIVLSTHLDCDHINGLTVVVEELAVKELWIHEPTVNKMTLALESALAKSAGRKERLTRLTASLSGATDLIGLARQKGITLREPFTGLSSSDGMFHVIGPTETYYHELLEMFRSYERKEGFLAKAFEAIHTVFESLEHETLGEDSDTSPENNSSAITLLSVDGRSLIFTGDAGAHALHRAADYLDWSGFDWSTLRFMQIPHHGSRRNVTPSVLDRYLGPKVQYDVTKSAFVSCAPEGGPKHPAKKVTNAFLRRGAGVFETCGHKKWDYFEAPSRVDWYRATPLPFYDQVEE
jgi:beta-lactamase superfamily II metal-dependent hydrolase